ncbi:B12-binding domain-containing radical SAM protein [Magnetospira sp. QH-2]|uniref:B12-binding domain-containing radical SAM protein n=1 Tax=Magnetospira sp. (strain QH-2) TaxID=1288970 RepID=UPI0003E819D6|nr:B12-binding domain-containing radical SAM protein [Magnetospira sp. QH-2]CCQ75268.1 protein of unknown function[Include B12 binding domain and Radical SAM superfamily domain] [Magnetospira sp. QH-2]
MKILLVLPNFGEGRGYNFPLGIAYISSSLKQAGHEVECINLHHVEGRSYDQVRRAAQRFQPDLCATGGLSSHYHLIAEILQAAKDGHPPVVTVGGGGLVTAAPDWVVGHMPMDIGVIGEGEETMVDLARVLEARDRIGAVPGLVWQGADGRAQRTEARKTLKDLDQLPWPDLESFDVEKMVEEQVTSDSFSFDLLDDPRSVPMVASRSCPYKCTFCFHPTGQVYRQRGLDDFFNELEFNIERFGINMVEVLDELFAYKRPRMEEFCRRIKDYGVKWWTSLHVRVVEPDVIDIMRDAGCVVVGYGIENVHETILGSMQKKSTEEMINHALKSTFGKGLAVRGNLIFGDPEETLETANYTLDWWARNRAWQISLVPLQVLPGSPVYKRVVAEGRMEDDPAAVTQWHQNVTRMDNETYARLMGRVNLFDYGLLRPAKIHAFEESASPGRDGNPQYDIAFDCVHCGGRNEFHNVLPTREKFQRFRFACRHCGAYSDVRNLARPPWRDPEAAALLQQGIQARTESRTLEAMQLLRKAAAWTPGDGGVDLPEEAVLASFMLGNMLLVAKDVKGAIHLLSRAVMARPFDANLHAGLASALLQEGSHGAARLHAQQARLLAAEDLPENLAQTLDGLDRAVAAMAAVDPAPRYI